MPDDDGRKIRIIFASEKTESGVLQLSAAPGTPAYEVVRFTGSTDEIWRQAIARQPDLMILRFPDVGDRQTKCIDSILAGCVSRILVFTNSVLPEEYADYSGRVGVYHMSWLQTQLDGIVTRALSRGAEKNRYTVSEQAKTAGAAVLAEGVLAARIIAVGASTGGTEALASLFRGLSTKMPGIVVVQHMPPGFTAMFAERLNNELPFEVSEVSGNIKILPGTIHIAPGDRHLTVTKLGSSYYTSLGDTKKVNGHCPSVDVLFESVASVAGSAATGIILTGMGADGAKGLLSMRKRGAFTVGQDEKSSVVYGMPKKAYELGAVQVQADIRSIAGILTNRVAGMTR